ncbi:unnamed protein product [Phytophthora fragariaefolia]|uniref:Unnamed protein product n=1 Tax=Phytophthora fragariaefolia TaxID=1490495 RepID=A0A9W6TW28_9STRA|nr:unnamed protein product [Phytophthora fragariaefolia]
MWMMPACLTNQVVVHCSLVVGLVSRHQVHWATRDIKGTGHKMRYHEVKGGGQGRPRTALMRCMSSRRLISRQQSIQSSARRQRLLTGYDVLGNAHDVHDHTEAVQRNWVPGMGCPGEAGAEDKGVWDAVQEPTPSEGEL